MNLALNSNQHKTEKTNTNNKKNTSDTKTTIREETVAKPEKTSCKSTDTETTNFLWSVCGGVETTFFSSNSSSILSEFCIGCDNNETTSMFGKVTNLFGGPAAATNGENA